MASEEMVTYVDDNENQNFERVQKKHTFILTQHCQILIILRCKFIWLEEFCTDSS